jgi:hypothetical protein
MYARLASAVAGPLIAMATLPAPVAAQNLCADCFSLDGEEARAEGERPLRIELLSDLEFSRLALQNPDGGSAAIDPQTGRKTTDGGMADLGGYALEGRARVTGEPYRQIRVMLPASVTMRSPSGARVAVEDLQTDLPILAMLDASGTLEFSFGGRLISPGDGTGVFRGRIPISVDYN